jgi:hypothetical protein
MCAASLLYADYLSLGGVGMGTIFEATEHNFRLTSRSAEIPLYQAVKLRDTTLTRGLTEFGTARLLLHYAPQLIEGSIRSLAPAKSEKRLRKQLLVDTTRHLDGGPPPIIDSYEFPKEKLAYGESYPIDFLALLFVRLYGPEVVSRWIGGLEKIDLVALGKIDVGWIYRHNPIFVEDIPSELRPQVFDRMRAAGIEPFREQDWDHYRGLRGLLSEFHNFPA